MVWRSLHHKEILLSEPGRNRKEFISTRNSPLHRIRNWNYVTVIIDTLKPRKYWGPEGSWSPENHDTCGRKMYCSSQQVDHMQVLNWTGTGGQKSKLPLLASHTSDGSQASVDWKIQSLLHPYCDICGISIRGVTVTGLISRWFLMPKQCQISL